VVAIFSFETKFKGDGKGKGKDALVHAMERYMDGGDKYSLILNLGYSIIVPITAHI